MSDSATWTGPFPPSATPPIRKPAPSSPVCGTDWRPDAKAADHQRSGWLLLAGFIVVVAGGAVLIGVLLSRAFPGLRADDHNDALRFGYGVIAFVYAFFVGFVVSSMWGQINAADALARAEGAAVVQLARDRTVFDAADADRIRTALLEYARAADAEWPAAARGGSSPEAEQALEPPPITYRS